MVSETSFVPHVLCVPSSPARTTASTLGGSDFLSQRNPTMRSRVVRPLQSAALRAISSAETISTEASTDAVRSPPAKPQLRQTRSWKPLEVFSVSPFQKERARRVFSRRVSSNVSSETHLEGVAKNSAMGQSDEDEQFSDSHPVSSTSTLWNKRPSRNPAQLRASSKAEVLPDIIMGRRSDDCGASTTSDESHKLISGLALGADTAEDTADVSVNGYASNTTGKRKSAPLNGPYDENLKQTGYHVENEGNQGLKVADPVVVEKNVSTADPVLGAEEYLLESSSLPDATSFSGTTDSTAARKSASTARRRRTTAARKQGERKQWKKFTSHEELVEETLKLSGDPLEKDGGRVVIFRGNPKANLMVIGEGPGADEDRLGLPFVGRSGQLLDRIFRFAGFDVESDIYVTNVVKRRPLKNRAPTAAEVDYYRGLLLEEIRLVDPRLVILTGRSAMEAMLPDAAGITKMRGKWYSIGARVAMPVFHPSYLLRNPNAKSVMKEDVLEIRRKYIECVPSAQLSEIRNQGSS